MNQYGPEFWTLVFVGGLALLLILRFPVAIALLTVSAVGAVILYGFGPGVDMTIVSMVSGLATFTLTPIPMFLLMGELLFRSGVAFAAISAVDRMLGKLPGRLAFLSVGTGAVLGVLSGSVMASTAMLGGTLVPEMVKRGYSRRLAVGSVLGSGGLAMILPPSTVVIVWGATAGVPVGPLLIAGILPGIMMALGYAVIVACWSFFFGGAENKRSLVGRRTAISNGAADDAAPVVPGSSATAQAVSARSAYVNLIAVLLLVTTVLSMILFGIATPSESAAIGVALSVLLIVVQKRLSWSMTKVALRQTVLSSGMVFVIIAGAAIYGKVMAGSGMVTSFVSAVTAITGNAFLLVLIMLAIVILLGLFLESIAIVLLTIPLFMPIVIAAGIDPIWFGMLMIIAIQIGTITPPFGMGLFVMRQYAPKDMKMTEIYKAALPFIGSDLAVIGLLIAFPAIVTFLPDLM